MAAPIHRQDSVSKEEVEKRGNIVNRAGLSGRLHGEVDSRQGGFRTNRILKKYTARS